jgi:hypothetical protein
MSTSPLQAILEDLVSLFDRRQIAYLVMGGMAVRAWGVPRPTYDLDFTLDLDPARVPALGAALRERGYSVPEIFGQGFTDVLSGMRKFAAARFADGREERIDLFLVTTPYQRVAFGRRVRGAIEGTAVWLIAPEDLVLHKLIAGWASDLADASDLLWLNPGLDKAYLRHWGEILGVSRTLERKLAETGEPRP